MASISENRKRIESGELFSQTDTLIFDTVKKVCASFDRPVVARVAGGWVRDLLLGKKSDDIDLTVDCDDWKEFARRLQSEFDPSHEMALIEAKAEQSKNIATARVHVSKGVWLDLCELQQEVGCDAPATAESDAKRRDFTINAMFFNINESKVEDFVGGLGDLTNGKLRTPVPPIVTFTSDPLRIIRGFRFACLLGLEIDAAILETGPSIKEQLEKTTTRERIVTELTKTAKSERCVQLIDYLVKSGLFGSVFDKKGSLIDEKAPERARIALQRNTDPENNLMVMLAAVYLTALQSSKDPIVKLMGFPVKLSQSCEKLALGAKLFPTLPPQMTRLSVGHWIRAVGDIWLFVRCLLSDEHLTFFDTEFIPFVKAENLETVYTLKPLLNGKQICDAFNIRPGREVAAKLEQLIDWQIANPSGTADDFLKSVK